MIQIKAKNSRDIIYKHKMFLSYIKSDNGEILRVFIANDLVYREIFLKMMRLALNMRFY